MNTTLSKSKFYCVSVRFTARQAGQCFPLYYYEKSRLPADVLWQRKGRVHTQGRHDGFHSGTLPGKLGAGGQQGRHFPLCLWAAHSPDCRRTFAAGLKKMLTRLPLVEKPSEFWTFSKARRAPVQLHPNDEAQSPPPDVIVTGAEQDTFRMEKRRSLTSRARRPSRAYPVDNDCAYPAGSLRLCGQGRSAVEWIMERYQIRMDKASGITSDLSDWAEEQGKPRHIFDSLLSKITAAVETVKIVGEPPGLETAVDARQP